MRLSTFNILHGRSPDDGAVDLDRFAAAVRDLDADLLALQEVDRGQARSQGADLTQIAAEAAGAGDSRFLPALHGEPGSWVRATGDEPPAGPAYGVALLSRYPVLSWREIRLPALPLRVPVVFSGTRRLQLVRDEPRVAVVARVQAPGGRLTVVCTHLSFLPVWNVVQLRRLVRGLRGEEPLVILGDLNLATAQAVRASGLRPLAAGLTFPAHAPVRQIDHILGRGALSADGGQVRALPLSDHRALTVEVGLGKPAAPLTGRPADRPSR